MTKRKTDFEMVKYLTGFLVALTFFSGGSYDGEFFIMAQGDYMVITNFLNQHNIYLLFWIFSIIAQAFIIRSFFLVGKPGFNLIMSTAPPAYLICKVFTISLHAIILIPFFLLWIWICFAAKVWKSDGRSEGWVKKPLSPP